MINSLSSYPLFSTFEKRENICGNVTGDNDK